MTNADPSRAPGPAASEPDRAIPILPARSIEATAAFYRALGFAGGAHSADPGYAILRRGTTELHFFHHPALVPADSWAGCYIRVADVADWARRFASSGLGLPAHGIPRFEPPEDKPWGLRELALVDPDGNLVRVGQVLAAS